MISAKEAVVWIDRDTKQVMVTPFAQGRHLPPGHWSDPIGAAYTDWQDGNNEQRVRWMLETVLDLGMRGFALKDVLTAFAEVKEFRALGDESDIMGRALTSALP
jgi:hypothetical protein